MITNQREGIVMIRPILILTAVVPVLLAQTPASEESKPYVSERLLQRAVEQLSKSESSSFPVPSAIPRPRLAIVIEATKPCSIPLQPVRPRAQARGRVIRPPVREDSIRIIGPPAPPCESWPR